MLRLRYVKTSTSQRKYRGHACSVLCRNYGSVSCEIATKVSKKNLSKQSKNVSIRVKNLQASQGLRYLLHICTATRKKKEERLFYSGVFLMLTFAAVAVSLHQGAPGRVSLAGKSAHVQVADGQPDD